MGVGHMKCRTEIEGMVEALETVDQGPVQWWLQIETGSDILSVENTIILQGTVQLDKQVGNQTNTTNVQYRWGSDNITNPMIDTDQDKQTISPVEIRDNFNL